VKEAKRVVSVSLGDSKRDSEQEASFAGVPFTLARIGTDGNLEKYKELVAAWDGKCDAIGLGGIDLYIVAGNRRYTIREAKKLAAPAKVTPVVDGSGLKNTLERDTILSLVANGIFEMRGKKALLVSGVDRFGMAQALEEVGARVTYGDLMFALGIPLPIRSFRLMNLIGMIMLPLIVRLPFKWLYPTGEKQSQIRPKYAKHYREADFICGDFHYIKKHLPDSLSGKVIITNTTTKEDVQMLRQRGARMLVTSTPNIGGRSFGTNVMEGVLITLLGKKPEEATPAEYTELLTQLGWKPTVTTLQDDSATSLQAAG
jgi:hypothetical protein